MWRLANPFSALVLPLRVFGVAAFLYAFVRILAAPDLTSIVIAILGSLLWQAGTAAEEHSHLYRRLESTTLGQIMRTRPVRVPSWMPDSQFRSEHPDIGTDNFIVMTQDGYDAGIVTPGEMNHVPDGALSYSAVGQIAHPLSYVHALRPEDSVLEAFLDFRRSGHVFLPILNRRDALAGIVTAQDVHRWLNWNGHAPRSILAITAAKGGQPVEQTLAA